MTEMRPDHEAPKPDSAANGRASVKRTPREKKRLSYAKDRRNSYGENDKA